MADIGRIEAESEQDEEIVDVPIVDKNDEPYLAADGTPCTIGVLGSDSKEYIAADDKESRRVIKALRRSNDIDPKETRAGRIRKASAVVKRWHGWEAGGKELQCAGENVRALLSRNHILKQVEDGIQEHARFFRDASTS